MQLSAQEVLSRSQPTDVSINQHRDPNTLSNYHNWLAKHTEVNFEIDFDNKRLEGNVVLTLESRTERETDEVILDTSYLDVKSVKRDDASLEWSLASRIEPFGSPLTIKLGSGGVAKGSTIKLEIGCVTTKSCTALQWLEPAQTSNKKHPYMFSQCQAIHARSVFPCQDTPDVKTPYTFNIKSPLPTLVSGLPVSDGLPATTGEAAVSLYRFQQPVPIPSYLFAIASGDIAAAPIGPRSAVWTGPDELEACKWELERDMEKFLEIAEGIVYPYAWTTYNVLVLPPSFPYGGMENPQYTFATPTIISGDRENVDVIAHELSHSWSGNLVSNASWEHFWLNEGWTTYLERRIQGVLHGEAHRDFSAIIGWKGLEEDVKRFGADSDMTKLVVDLKGKDPDDAFSQVPYEKGSTFLYYLEKLIGREKWNKFIPHYFTEFKMKSLTSYDFKASLLSFFASDSDASQKLKEEVDWDGWFYNAGLPKKPDFDTTLADACYELADKWKSLAEENPSFRPSHSDIDGFTSNQSVVFLNALLSMNPLEKPLLKPEEVQRLGQLYGYTTSQNVELSSRYYQLALSVGDKPAYSAAAELVSKVGRMKFVRPIMVALKARDFALAEATYEKNKDFWHPICRDMVKKILWPKNDG